MTDTKFILNAPISMSMKVAVTDGNQIAQATYDFPQGKIQSKNEIDAAVINVVKMVQDQLGQGWSTCTKQEFFDLLMEEKTGTDQKFAMPGKDDWDNIEGSDQ